MFKISCASCNFLLLEGYLKHPEPFSAEAIIINEIAIICPNCFVLLNTAEDDLAREVTRLAN